MTEQAQKEQKYARVLSVSERRTFEGDPENLFDAWLDPATRRTIIGDGLYKNGVKTVDPVEGGEELTETRWRNQLMGTSRRRYLAIDRPVIILCNLEITSVTDRKTERQHVTTNELLLFKPAAHNQTEIVAFSQCIALRPVLISSVREDWLRTFRIFNDIRAETEEATT